MKCELESRNDGVMAVAPVADNYIPAKWCQAKECDKFKFLVPGPCISFAPDTPQIWNANDMDLLLNIKCESENDIDTQSEEYPLLYERSNLALYKVVSDDMGHSYTQEITTDQVSELPKGKIIVALPVDLSNLSQALKHYTQLTWGQNEQLEFSDEEEYYYALGLLCLNSWFPITFQMDPKRLTVQYRIYCNGCPAEFMPRAFRRAETTGGIINNNEYVRNLCENHGFLKTGNKISGNYAVVRKTVPLEYRDAFDKGYENFRSWGKNLGF